MAIFKGVETTSAKTPRGSMFSGYLMEKWVRANPDWIYYQGSVGRGTTDYMNEWELSPDVQDPRFLCYHVYLTNSPGWAAEKPYRIVASLGTNEAVHRFFRTLEEATTAYEAIQPYTTVKTLWNRGFRRW